MTTQANSRFSPAPTLSLSLSTASTVSSPLPAAKTSNNSRKPVKNSSPSLPHYGKLPSAPSKQTYSFLSTYTLAPTTSSPTLPLMKTPAKSLIVSSYLPSSQKWDTNAQLNWPSCMAAIATAEPSFQPAGIFKNPPISPCSGKGPPVDLTAFTGRFKTKTHIQCYCIWN